MNIKWSISFVSIFSISLSISKWLKIIFLFISLLNSVWFQISIIFFIFSPIQTICPLLPRSYCLHSLFHIIINTALACALLSSSIKQSSPKKCFILFSIIISVRLSSIGFASLYLKIIHAYFSFLISVIIPDIGSWTSKLYGWL